jgi:hypothetical protein
VQRRFFLLAPLVLILACSDSNPTGPSGPGDGSDSSLTARIDGALWTGAAVVATHQNNILSIGGASGGLTLGFAVGRGTGGALTPGTYTFAPLEAHNATLFTATGQGWFAGPSFGSGTVVLTSISATGAAGTFSFMLVPTPGSGASGDRAITQGTFNVRF